MRVVSWLWSSGVAVLGVAAGIGIGRAMPQAQAAAAQEAHTPGTVVWSDSSPVRAVAAAPEHIVAPASPPARPPARVAQEWTREQILRAIRIVESGDAASPPDGDGGLALGPYQIWHGYWQDALAADPSLRRLGGRLATHADCRDAAYAGRVVEAYMRRYVPAAWAARDAEVIARTHNGGPTGARRGSTLAFWSKARVALDVTGSAATR